MIAIDTSTKSLQLVLAGAKNTNDASWTATFVDAPKGSPGSVSPLVKAVQGTTNGVAAVTIIAAPGGGQGDGGWVRRLTGFQLFNADLAAITITLQIVDTSGPTTTILSKVTRQTLENFTYEEGNGFLSFDVNGAQIAQAPTTSANVSGALSTATQASSMASIALNGSSQASSLASGIVLASLNSVSSQASSMAGLTPASVSSQASSTAALTPASVSSQASSMAALVPASVSSAASLGLLTSAQISGASSFNFTSTNWSTASSTVSRVKSSFTW